MPKKINGQLLPPVDKNQTAELQHLYAVDVN